MAGLINLPEETIQANIEALNACYTELIELQNSLVADLNTLASIWSGFAANAYIDCANQMNQCVVTPMGRLLHAYADAINNGAYQLNFKDKEISQSVSSEFGGITTITSVE